ncbi:MAG: hypothetical protein U0931_16250 [Vulcanimicrobiota bacterium]
MKKLRGTAMIHTLALISLVLLAAFALAASSLSQLNLSSRYAQRTQADYTARAAMTEFVVRARALTGTHDVTSLPEPIFPKFRGHEVLLENQPRVEGRAVLLLDKCVDNSGGSLPAQSSFDPPGKTSVPPYCLSVVYEVTLGSRHYNYESLVQQRWPYALTAPGPVLIPGRVGPSPTGEADVTGLPPKFWTAPSEVKGRVLALETDVGQDVDSHKSGESRQGNLTNPIKVSMGAYEALYPYAYSGGVSGVPIVQIGGGPSSTHREDSDSRMVLGGGYKMYKLTYGGQPVARQDPFALRENVTGPAMPTAPTLAPAIDTQGGMPQGLVGGANTPPERGWEVSAYYTNTKGAVVHRGVDLVQNQPPNGDGLTTQQTVTVREGNTLNGRARYDYWLNGQDPSEVPSRERMRQLFAKPDTSSWPVNNFPKAKEIIIARDPAPPNLSSSSGLPTPPVYIQAASGQLRYHGNFEPEGYSLDSPLGVEFAQGMAEYLGLPEGYSVQGSLTLQDVSLAVDGNFSLTNYVLKGSRATLIVDGTLTLDGGYLNAGDNGLVIFCRRLIMKAQGNFNGLIVAEKGAAIYGAGSAEPPPAPGLNIKGGLLIGGTDLLVMGVPSVGGGPVLSRMLSAMSPLQMRGIMLTSCKLEYAPQYLRGLNNFGNYEVLATEQRQ